MRKIKVKINNKKRIIQGKKINKKGQQRPSLHVQEL